MASTALETRHAIQKYIVGSGEHARASARRQGNGMALRSNDRRPQKDATSMFAKLCGYKKSLGCYMDMDQYLLIPFLVG